jgi:hypothetical protein
MGLAVVDIDNHTVFYDIIKLSAFTGHIISKNPYHGSFYFLFQQMNFDGFVKNPNSVLRGILRFFKVR